MPVSSAPGIAGLRILLVEDHSFQRWVVQGILHTLGARQVLVAIDGRRAMEILRKLDAPPDLIITDLDMPGMDGMELMRHLGRERCSVPLIVTSALDRGVLATVRAMGEAYGVEVIAALQKPTTLHSLGQAIDGHLAHVASRAGAPAVTAVEVHCALREGELEARFEPRVEIATRSISSAQASLVWADPGRGIVPAASFMETVRHAGLSVEIALRVLRESLSAAARWRGDGLQVGIAVPVPAECLRVTGFAERIEDCAATVRMTPAAVVLQFDAVPEGDAFGTMLENLTRLRMKGFATAIPYGPGCRDPRLFARAGCSELTVELSRYAGVRGDDAELAMLAGDLEGTRALGVSICAHGVRTRGDWDLAGRLLMRTAAGPCFGVPLPASAFEKEVARRPAWRGFR